MSKYSKMKLLYIMAIVILMGCFTTEASYALEDKAIKKVVSIVYDDSGSMKQNENWAYASYALQNLTGLLSASDEINVVKMSDESHNTTLNLGTESDVKKEIKNISKWKSEGMTTPFEAVETAANWLKQKKQDYSDAPEVEYWLVVITDGEFETGKPKDLSKYLSDLKGDMGESKYESIFVGIGKNIPQDVIRSWQEVAGNYYISASNKEGIVTAMSKVAGLISGRGMEGESVKLTKSPDGKSVTVTSNFPLRKLIVYQQEQSVDIKSVAYDGGNLDAYSDFITSNPGSDKLQSRIIHYGANNYDYIPAGDIVITFKDNIDLKADKFKVLVDAAVEVKLSILDGNGRVLEGNNIDDIVEGDMITYAAEIINSIDKTPVDISHWKDKVSGTLVINNEYSQMTYDQEDNKLYGDFTIQRGSNVAYAIVSLPGFFRVKSEVINLYPIEVITDAKPVFTEIKVEVPYIYSDEYQLAETLEYSIVGGDINGSIMMKISNMPKGIAVSVNDIVLTEDGEITLRAYSGRGIPIKILRNIEYKEDKELPLTFEVTSEQYVLNWAEGVKPQITLVPVEREITLNEEKISEDSFKVTELSGKEIYRITPYIKDIPMTYEELKECEIFFTSNKDMKYTYELDNSGSTPEIVVYGEDSLVFLAPTGEINSSITLKTAFGEEYSQELTTYTVKDSLIKWVIPLVILLVIVLLIGYIPGIKKRFDRKNYSFEVAYDSEIYESYGINIDTVSRFIPYIPQKGNVASLSFKATGNKNIVAIDYKDLSGYEHIKLEDEAINENFKLSTDQKLTLFSEGQKESYIYKCTKYSSGNIEEDDFLTDDFSFNGEEAQEQGSEDDNLFNF
ncbi:vWA domain-containing protein [Alloiococcus sp. CFN-8]|uniref:vWA domain-containing protein n=1 Tax=Alloiococcus sp. CFN-8 TaxID=3416081 RepID=UPI003CEDE159